MKRVLLLVVAIAVACVSAKGQLSGIYVEFYNPTAPYHVAPDGWQTVPNFPCRHGPDPDNDGIPSSLGTPEPGLPSGSNISLTNVNSVNYRVFAVSPTTTDIGTISVSGGASVPTLFIGEPAGGFPIASQFARLPVAGARNLGGLSYGLPKLRVQGFIHGTLTGSMSVHEIVRFDFGTPVSSGTGMISANITHNPGADATVTQLGGIFAKRVAPGSVITSYNSNIRVLETYSDFEGSVQTTSGKNIQSMIVGRDFKGSISSAGNITNLQIVRNGTGSITATGNLGIGIISGHWGALPSGSTPNYQSSSIAVGGSISTNLSVTGDFVGQLQAGSISQMTVGGGFYNRLSGTNTDGSILVSGNIQTLTVGTPVLGTATGNMFNLEADSVTYAVTLAGNYASGSALLRDGLPGGSIFHIGGTLASGVTIELEHDPLDANDFGLEGQIVVNQSNGSGDWFGNIQINDGSTLTGLAKNYITLSKDIGNGAAGAAPFNFHQFTGPLPASRADLDCDPFHTESLAIGACETVTSLEEVVIDHYGPVFVQGAADQYRVEFLPAFIPITGPVWYDVSSRFIVDTTFTATTEASAHRAVRLISAPGYQADFAAAATFRFRPLVITKDGIDEHQVRCAWVAGNPGVAYNSSVVSGDLGNTTSGPQYHWYEFHVALTRCRLDAPLFEGNRVNASDIAEWLNEPFEVNMDGGICAQDLADMLAAYEPE